MGKPRYFRRIFALFLAAAMAPAAAISLVYSSLAGSALRREAESRLDSQAAAFAAAVAAIADSCARDLGALAQDPAVLAALKSPGRDDPLVTARAYRRVLARFPGRDGPAEASILSADGEVAILTGTRPDDRNLSTYGSWGIFRELASDETAVSPRVATLSDGATGSFSVGVRIMDGDGGRLGFAIADVRRSAIAAAAVSSGLPGGAAVVFPSGKIVFNRSDASLEGGFRESLPEAPGSVLKASAAGAEQDFIVYAEAPAGFYDGFGASSRNIALAGLAGAVGLAAVLALQASSSVTEPVLRMARSMRLVEAGDLTIRIEPSGDDELGDLARSFNTMTAEVAALLKREVERQELLRESELRALAAQMNPHFLHNTLASIKSLAKLGRADEIALVVSRLGKILRAGAGRREGRSSIGDGLAFVRDYLGIEKVRFGERFNFVIDVPREMEAIALPPLSLEPLAENALTHGLECKRGHGTLTIRGRLDGGDAVVTFEDDGPGMDADALEALGRALGSDETPSGGHGMGLLGTNRRLALEYGHGYGLRIGPADGDSGFRVELRVPAGAAS